MKTGLLLALSCPSNFRALVSRGYYVLRENCPSVYVNYICVDTTINRVLPEIFRKEALYV